MPSTVEDTIARLSDAGELSPDEVEMFAQLAALGELPSDEPPMESRLHYEQLALLVSSLEHHWREREDFFIGANLSVYYSLAEVEQRQFRGPDFFLITGVSREPRKSWTVWREGGRYPEVIIELLSTSTASVDRKDKKILYHDIFRTPEYFWFSPDTTEFAGFSWTTEGYQAIPPDAKGHLPSQVMGLSLGVLEGQLRYFGADGSLVLTPAEDALKQTQRADTEAQRADTEAQRAAKLAAKLQALGIDPEAD